MFTLQIQLDDSRRVQCLAILAELMSKRYVRSVDWRDAIERIICEAYSNHMDDLDTDDDESESWVDFTIRLRVLADAINHKLAQTESK